MDSNNTIKIVFLGAKNIGLQCFHHLLSLKPKWNIEIMGLMTNMKAQTSPNLQIIKEAESLNIPILQNLDDIPECDYIVSVQYHEILKQEHIDKARLRAVNLHLAPLPEYRGCNQFSFAIFNQEKEFGVSLHEINANIDDGELIAEKRWAIADDIWVEELWKQSNEKGVELFQESFPKLFENPSLNIPKKEAKSHLYYRKDINQLKELYWYENPDIWQRKVRATHMPGFEPPYYILDNGEKVYVDPEEFKGM